MAVHNDILSGGGAADVAALCRFLDVPRSTVYYRPSSDHRQPVMDKSLAERIYGIIMKYPMFGIRRVWAYLRYRLGEDVNRKKVARLMRLKGWTMAKRKAGMRPRVNASSSITERPDERWATDITMVFCGDVDGWCSLVPVIDCCTREVLGWELSHTARAKTAERALETALIGRFGWVRGAPEGMMIRSDNGLVFGSKLYRRLIREYRLRQEYITPYTPEENGLAERFMRSFKEECAWANRFESIEEARSKIAKWIDWYNTDRPHQALGYMTPRQRWEQFKLAA
jgi:putative transposase